MKINTYSHKNIFLEFFWIANVIKVMVVFGPECNEDYEGNLDGTLFLPLL